MQRRNKKDYKMMKICVPKLFFRLFTLCLFLFGAMDWVYSYDTADRPTLVKQGSAELGRTWDTSTGRIKTYTNAAGETIEYDFTPGGKIKTIKYPGDKTVTYTYTAGGNLNTKCVNHGH